MQTNTKMKQSARVQRTALACRSFSTFLGAVRLHRFSASRPERLAAAISPDALSSAAETQPTISTFLCGSTVHCSGRVKPKFVNHQPKRVATARARGKYFENGTQMCRSAPNSDGIKEKKGIMRPARCRPGKQCGKCVSCRPLGRGRRLHRPRACAPPASRP
jgi:hypothetical protein